MPLELEMTGEGGLLAGNNRPHDLSLLIVCLIDILRSENESTPLICLTLARNSSKRHCCAKK